MKREYLAFLHGGSSSNCVTLEGERACRWYLHQWGRVQNPETDSQGGSTDSDEGTEAVRGGGGLKSGTRAI